MDGWTPDQPRPKERIPLIMAELMWYWARNPQLRLGQIIGNLSNVADPYFYEDKDLLEALSAANIHLNDARRG